MMSNLWRVAFVLKPGLPKVADLACFCILVPLWHLRFLASFGHLCDKNGIFFWLFYNLCFTAWNVTHRFAIAVTTSIPIMVWHLVTLFRMHPRLAIRCIVSTSVCIKYACSHSLMACILSSECVFTIQHLTLFSVACHLLTYYIEILFWKSEVLNCLFVISSGMELICFLSMRS